MCANKFISKLVAFWTWLHFEEAVNKFIDHHKVFPGHFSQICPCILIKVFENVIVLFLAIVQ